MVIRGSSRGFRQCRHKENKVGNSETKVILGKREHQNLTFREQGNTREISLGSEGNTDPPSPTLVKKFTAAYQDIAVHKPFS